MKVIILPIEDAKIIFTEKELETRVLMEVK